MGIGPQEEFKVCPVCGAFYMNLCVHCTKAGIEERVLELMDRHGLKEDELIRILAEQVKDGKFPALNLAIALRDMKPADRHEVDLTEGKKLNDARDRISSLLSKITGRKRSEPVSK
jgi:hypothetical protein